VLPVAAAGKPLKRALVHDPIVLSIPPVQENAEGLEGAVVYVDRFGNLTSNIDKTKLSKFVGTVCVGNVTIQGLSRFFGEVPEGQAMALINSFGLLEIAVNQGNAAQVLGIGKDEPVRVFWT
jgi:S-adenosylmethionine hydrolase